MLLEVGRVVRPHGLHGEVVVELVSNRPERTVAGAVFETEGGTLRLARARRLGKRWLMRFDGVDGHQGAEALRDRVLRAEALADEGVLWVHELVGALCVLHADGTEVGRVRSVVSNPASDLLELEDGRLVPMSFVVARFAGRVEIDPPPGLLER